MFAFLWGVGLYAFVIYRRFHFQSYRALWNREAVTWPHMRPILLRWLIACVLMLLFVLWYDPERAFYLPRHAPEVIPWVMFAYPVLSALPQEFIFCTFFFARYQPFFGAGKMMVFVSALVFAYAHVLYINPVAPVLSFAGGLIFAHTFRLHKSLALVTIEHALYGNALFLIGLGWYFYSGGVAG